MFIALAAKLCASDGLPSMPVTVMAVSLKLEHVKGLSTVRPAAARGSMYLYMCTHAQGYLHARSGGGHSIGNTESHTYGL